MEYRAPEYSIDTINKNVLETHYAVRGEVVIRATEIEEHLEDYPFDEIIYCNIGNPQRLGQKPITFFRDVISLVENPRLLQNEAIRKIFKPDVIRRAEYILKNLPGGVGAYSHSQGVKFVREDVADFIGRRDGIRANPDDIFLTDGASAGVTRIINTLIRDERDAVMIPVPQYPLYSATLSLLGGALVGYYLDEENGWGLNLKDLEESLKKAVSEDGLVPRAIVVINPGNPTGSCLPRENMLDIIRFAKKYNLLLMADEVYQENVYYPEDKPFYSFRRLILESDEFKDSVKLISFHSISKGVLGECGHRGGYFETTNIPKDIKGQLYKLASVSLCPNVVGQLFVSLMTNPPKEGDESFEEYKKEVTEIYESLRRRSIKLSKALNEMKGISCQISEGAMYAFPTIKLPKKAIEEAKRRNMKSPATFYCIECLESIGLCIVPGDGFKEKPGTFHFRTTFLPLEEKMDKVIASLKEFNDKFMEKYKD